MATVFTLGMMAECIKEIIFMIRKMDMAFIHGKMVASMMAIGRMENNMVPEFIIILLAKRRKEDGKMGSE